MAPLVSNDLNSPVSLLWAHQLRREHATIVAQLEELQALHPSASELKKLVTRTEKTEAATTKLRKDFTDLKTAHQKNKKNISGIAEDVRAYQKAHAGDVAVREENEQSFQLEIEAFRAALTLQEGEVASTSDELKEVRRLAEDGKATMEQKLLQKEDEIVELRSLIQALERRIQDEITVVRDSVELPRLTGAPAAARDNISETESFDLDANMLTVTAAPSGLVLGPSLAMIKEPTLPRYTLRVRDQQHSSVGESLQMLPEPSIPPCPKQQLNSNTAAEPVRQTDYKLEQGRCKLATYIQIADSQHQETPPGEEDRFVNAFVRGLRDKRDKKKCEKKLRGSEKTWENVKECFPVASQHSQGNASNDRTAQQAVVQQQKLPEPKTRGGNPPTLPPAKERREAKQGVGQRRGPTPLPTLPPDARADQAKRNNRAAERTGSPRYPAETKTKQTALVEQDKHEAGAIVERTTLIVQDVQEAVNRACLPRTPPPPPPPAGAAGEKRRLDEQEDGVAVVPLEAATPAAEKKRKTGRRERRARRRERPPSIPILPSSEDEFA